MRSWNTTSRNLALALVLALAMAGSARAQDGFLKLGDIGSGVQGEGHKDWIELIHVDLDPPGNTLTAEAGMRRTLRFTKRLDRASPLIQQALAKNERFPEVTLRVPKGGGSQEYQEIKLENVIISSYQTGGPQDRPTESISLNFTKITYNYPEKKLAGPAGPVKAGYDLEKVEEGAAGPGEGPPTAELRAAVADLLPLDGLRLATSSIPWGQTATISTDAASSKQAGHCFFRYRYDTGNQGQAAAGPATNRIHLDAANGPALADDALPGLAAGDQQTASGLLPLKEGLWTLYVHVDDGLVVAEGDEQNNLRRVRVRVEGSCQETPTRKDATPPSVSGEQPSGAAKEHPSNWLRVGAVHTGNVGEVLLQMPEMPAEKVVVRGWDPKRVGYGGSKTLEIQVPPGALQNALKNAHQAGMPLSLVLKAQDGTKYLQWELKTARVTSYDVSGATDMAPATAVLEIEHVGLFEE